MDADEIKRFYKQSQAYRNVVVPPGEMSPRERFFAIMNFEKFDRIIDCEFGYWFDTLKRWQAEGLPADIDTVEKADLFFGLDQWTRSLSLDMGLLPDFPEEIVEQNERYIVKYDNRRIKCRVFSDGKDTIPHYLDFPIKDRKSYLPFKERFLPQLEQRLPGDVSAVAAAVADRNYVLAAYIGSTAGWIRDLMGFENFSLAICLQPALLAEILEDFRTLFTAVARVVAEHLEVDLLHWWEDIAFKNGPITPPDFFRAQCGPVYKSTMDIFAARGTRFADVDCDGDMSLLVPTWLENGINIMFPLEVKSGIHPERLRKKYPGVRMMGGFDKKVLTLGKDAIKKEWLRLKSLVREGGFIPHVDHRVQADVPLKNYLYYLQLKREILEIPNTVQYDRRFDF